jgi:hypothetical protein
MIYFNGRPAVGFGANESAVRAPPPLELRTAYTVKGLGIGAGGLLGFLAFGPIGMILLGGAGRYAGNRAAVNAERKYTDG